MPNNRQTPRGTRSRPRGLVAAMRVLIEIDGDEKATPARSETDQAGPSDGTLTIGARRSAKGALSRRVRAMVASA